MDGLAFCCWATLMRHQSETLYEYAIISAVAEAN